MRADLAHTEILFARAMLEGAERLDFQYALYAIRK
jgi:hypothetical protein